MELIGCQFLLIINYKWFNYQEIGNPRSKLIASGVCQLIIGLVIS